MAARQYPYKHVCAHPDLPADYVPWLSKLETRATATQQRAAQANKTLKDPYLFDFLGLGDEAHEREIAV